MIEIKKQGNQVMPLTRWAVAELINESIIDTFDIFEFFSEDANNEDELDSAIGHWFTLMECGEFMLSESKFNNKIEYIQ